MTTMKKDDVLELRRNRDGTFTEYTAQMFRDEVMKDRRQMAFTKFYSGVRDDWQKDTMRDPVGKRRSKRYSFTRDSIEGPREHGFAAFGGNRFFAEIESLKSRGVLTGTIDIYNDDEMINVFKTVQMQLATGSPDIARKIVDAAPSVYLYTELMKRAEIIVEEELTKLWARTVFPVRNLNTWLTMWDYRRISDADSALPQYVNYDEVPSNIGSSRERVASQPRSLVFYDTGASYTQHELWVAAEAIANGAVNLNLDTRRINVARRNLLWKENVLAFFGDPDVNINGLMSPEASTGIVRVAATTQFGSGTAEADRHLLIDAPLAMIDETEELLTPNMIGLPLKPFLHCISRRYGTTDNPSDQTVAQATLATLSEIGITSLTMIPELGARPAEATRLQKKGLPAAEATRLAGGLNVLVEDVATQVDVMLVARKDSEVAEMIMAKDVTLYPAAETVRGKTEIRMVQGSGGVEFYKPAGYKLVTNVTGPNTLNYVDP